MQKIKNMVQKLRNLVKMDGQTVQSFQNEFRKEKKIYAVRRELETRNSFWKLG